MRGERSRDGSVEMLAARENSRKTRRVAEYG